ncbi:branched-chain amino acid ABC transporter permease [Paraburkholderia sp. BL25I1N1]|uniref:branched-chain amino acid ABC transporter permease n=1 Tax=Paraburkholderia sp. BL25I1N1 TaxID=1938804 RepID=UPI000D04F422|nr:branched-chain amino acid ABC transporter permease [Paraburkholderia sp. BL25I1N1]PRX96443.1 amino acid/amide ABC transporter membrane protein 1 (HAAT family) [Paraburkholderia sp. BL25I1N1]
MDLTALTECLVSAPCLVTQTMTGLVIAFLLFLAASGLTLVFGVLRVTNFAHGTFYMLGAYFTIAFYRANGSFLVAVIGATLLVAASGALFERTVISRVKDSNPLMILLGCYGVVLIADDLVKIFWGSAALSTGMPEAMQLPPVQLGGGVVPVYYLVLIGISATVGIASWLLINRSGFGRAVQAVAEVPKMAAALGINTRLYAAVVVAVGCGLAGLAGSLASPMRATMPGVGFSILIECFVVTVIGGMGSIFGALLAALFIGLTRSYGSIAMPLFTEGLTFVAMLIVLCVKPTGLFAVHERP